MSDRAPDVVGEMVGWRVWEVVWSSSRVVVPDPLMGVDFVAEDAGSLPTVHRTKVVQVSRAHLLSLNGTSWPSDDWLYAACDSCKEPPGEWCSCGLHAARDAAHLEKMGYHQANRLEPYKVAGEVAMAGKIIPGSLGWKAAKARPKCLWVPFRDWRLAAALRETYKVPVGLANIHGRGLKLLDGLASQQDYYDTIAGRREHGHRQTG